MTDTDPRREALEARREYARENVALLDLWPEVSHEGWLTRTDKVIDAVFDAVFDAVLSVLPECRCAQLEQVGRRLWKGWEPSEVVDGEGVWTLKKPWPEDDVEEWMSHGEAVVVAALEETT